MLDPCVQPGTGTRMPTRRCPGPVSRAGLSRAILILAVASLLAARSGATVAQTPRSAQRMLVVTQTAGPALAAVTARIGTLTFGPTGLASDRIAETLSNASAIAQVAVRDFGPTLSQSQLLAQARTHLGSQAPALAAALSAVLQSRGLSQATFALDQEVAILGSPVPRRLAWTLSVDRSGRASFGEPRLFDAQPHILHVQYIPLRVASGLPTGWAYPDGGRLRWQRLDLFLQPIGPAATLDTGGAFDAPDALDGSTTDPEAGLRCLIDRRARSDCAQAPTDIVTLIDAQGSASALVDYGLRLAPVYDAVPAADGSHEQVARVSLQVDRRELAYAGCAADMAYRNTGQYGYTLAAASDRYAVSPDGRFARLNRTDTTTLSPTVAYDWTRPLRPVSAAALTALILDPQDPTRPMLAAADVANLIHLAPITTSGQREHTVVSFTAPPNDRNRLQVEVRCSDEGVWTIRSQIAPWAQCRSGGCNSTYITYQAMFTSGQAALAAAGFTAVNYRGQPWEPQQAGYDGGSTLTVWHEDYTCGGRIAAQFSFDGRYLGTGGEVDC
jgi:hypothetical protein